MKYLILFVIILICFNKQLLPIFKVIINEILTDKCNKDENLGLEKLRKTHCELFKSVAVLGAPISLGQPRDGTEMAPNLIRDEGLISLIKSLEFKSVIDYGNLNFIINNRDANSETSNNFTKIKMQYTVGDAIDQMSIKVEEILEKGNKLVVLGGDHSVTTGSIIGHSNVKSNICVIYIDAHADINTCETTRSGNIHGMPLSLVIEQIPASHKKHCPGLQHIEPVLSVANLGYLALRDIDAAELQLINDLGIMRFTMEDIDKHGIRKVVNQLIDSVCGDSRAIHVSFDIDSVDASLVPNTGTPVPGGLTFREALQIGEIIAKTNRLEVIEMYEVNTKVGRKSDAPKTINLAINIILSFLGKSRESLYGQPCGNEHYDMSNL